MGIIGGMTRVSTAGQVAVLSVLTIALVGAAMTGTLRPSLAAGVVLAPLFWLVSARESWTGAIAYALGFAGLACLAGTGGSPARSPVLDSVLALAGFAGLVVAATALWRHRAVRWPSVAWVGLGAAVSVFSGPVGGAGRLLKFLRENLGLSPEAADAVNFVIRKGTHVTLYGLMALAAFRVASGLGRPGKRALLLALLWAVAHAGYDEWNQALFDSRTGSAGDVVLDLVGAALFAGAAAWAQSRREAAKP